MKGQVKKTVPLLRKVDFKYAHNAITKVIGAL